VLNHAPLRSSVVRFRSTLPQAELPAGGLGGCTLAERAELRSNSGLAVVGRGFPAGSGAEGRWRWGREERPPGSAGGCGMGAARPRRQMLRAERSGARTMRSGWKWRAPGGRFGEGMVGIAFCF
jgi:hypothetical protein